MDSKNIRLDIYDVLDLMNNEIGYIGIDHKHKSNNTNERDDIIGRTAFNNWKKSFNQQVEQGLIKGSKINEERKGKYITYLESDIRRLIHEFHDNLTTQYMKKTISIDEFTDKQLRIKLSEIGPRVPKTWKTGFQVGDYTHPNIEEQIEKEMNKIIESFIDVDSLRMDIVMNHFNRAELDQSISQIKKYIITDLK